MTSFENSKIPPPQAPVPPGSAQIENRYLSARSSKEKQIEEIIEIFESLALTASKQKNEYNKLFENLNTIRHFLLYNLLDPDNLAELKKQISILQDKLGDGSLKLPELSEKIAQLILKFEESNPKITLLKKIEVLEACLCFYPLENLPPMKKEEFESIMEPFFHLLKSEITKFDVKNISNKLEEILENLLTDPRKFIKIIDHQLKILSEEIQINSF